MKTNHDPAMAEFDELLEQSFRAHYYPPMDKDWRFLDAIRSAASKLADAREAAVLRVALFELKAYSEPEQHAKLKQAWAARLAALPADQEAGEAK